MSIKNKNRRKKQLASRKKAIRGLRPMPPAQRHQYNISDVREKAYIRIQDKVYLVESVSHYQEYNWKLTKAKKFVSYELDLFCLNNGEHIHLEWEKDDRIEVYLTTQKIRFNQVLDEKNVVIDASDLEQIVDDEDTVFYQSRAYHYDDDWAAMYYRDQTESKNDGIRVRFYEFCSDDGQCLTIEQWMDGPPADADTDFEYEVYLSQAVDVDDIEILSLGSPV